MFGLGRRLDHRLGLLFAEIRIDEVVDEIQDRCDADSDHELEYLAGGLRLDEIAE